MFAVSRAASSSTIMNCIHVSLRVLKQEAENNNNAKDASLRLLAMCDGSSTIVTQLTLVYLGFLDLIVASAGSSFSLLGFLGVLSFGPGKAQQRGREACLSMEIWIMGRREHLLLGVSNFGRGYLVDGSLLGSGFGHGS